MREMIVVTENSPITVEELKDLSEEMENQVVKAVLDLELGRLVVGMAHHQDGEEYLLEQEIEEGENEGKTSVEQNTLGITFHPWFHGTKRFIDPYSMINVYAVNPTTGRLIGQEEITDKNLLAEIDVFVGRRVHG